MSKPRIDILERKNEIIEWVKLGKSKGEISILLDCKWNTLTKYLNILNLKIVKSSSEYKGIHEYLKRDIYIGNTNHFKYKLIKSGIKKHVCEKCNRTEWEGYKIPIELHHIDGDRSNNTLENLEILCSNCHTLTDNYKSKKIKDTDIITNNYCNCRNVKCGNSKQCLICYKSKSNKITKPKNSIVRKNKRKISNCIECGSEFKCRYNKGYEGNKFCSIKCNNLNKSNHLPAKEQLILDFVELKSFVQVGKKYNVSDSAVRKWCKKYDIIKKDGYSKGKEDNLLNC